MRRAWQSLSVCVALLLTNPLGPAAAHDRYTTWQRPDGEGSCCSGYDCRPVQWRERAGRVEIRIEELGGAWHAAPPATFLPFASFDEHAHACYVVTGCREPAGCRPHFYCVTLPAAM